MKQLLFILLFAACVLPGFGQNDSRWTIELAAGPLSTFMHQSPFYGWNCDVFCFVSLEEQNYATGGQTETARRIFEKAKAGYHAVSRNSLEALLAG